MVTGYWRGLGISLNLNRKGDYILFSVQGLKKTPVGSYKEIEDRMAEGTANRTVAATKMNATSRLRSYTFWILNPPDSRIIFSAHKIKIHALPFASNYATEMAHVIIRCYYLKHLISVEHIQWLNLHLLRRLRPGVQT